MSRPSVPLPSIRDIFPEMSMQGNPGFPKLSPSPTASTQSPPLALNKCPPSKQPSYSFNVLRADPVTSSLEHVASSTTLRPRAATSLAHPGMHGAAPVFRVAMTPTDQRPPRHRPPHRTVREILPDTRERHQDSLPPSIPREADLVHLRSPSSTILSFPVSDHPVSTTAALITTDGRRVHLRSEIPGAALQGEGRGKKHQCPHCGKRFNRPSSMKIHVNTHTGAKRTWRFIYLIMQRVGPYYPFFIPIFSALPWLITSSDSVSLSISGLWARVQCQFKYAPALAESFKKCAYGLPHPALMSPPATNSSVSEGNSEDEAYSDDEDYPMDVDVDRCDIRRTASGDEGMRVGPGGQPLHPVPPPTAPMKGSAGSSSSSDVSVWSRSASPARTPASPSAYSSHGHGPQLHRHVDQQGRSHHAHPHGQTSECIYRPSIPAYAISCTDSRVSTALRPAFTSSSSYPVRDRDRYHGRGRESRRHGHGHGQYTSRG
ncbi:hypothetical protein JVT61DRAFT_3546 [Boletus reticuloceps]|uniref:C2H2-type domain-containing protein n=1 Tax=Boletus reticuloceps TaxID=495285 RepID=A0A8I2YMJ3_9AGAM|nr:hypothetical protein JVT61DRAFT_3546 [Boletus reticuloceps]